jgi:hypothetical protein
MHAPLFLFAFIYMVRLWNDLFSTTSLLGSTMMVQAWMTDSKTCFKQQMSLGSCYSHSASAKCPKMLELAASNNKVA